MANRTDILLDYELDLQEDPDTLDWVEDISDDQHVQLMVITEKGENREFPFAGFGAKNRLKGKFDKEKILRDLDVELELDGYTDATVELGNNILDLTITV